MWVNGSLHIQRQRVSGHSRRARGKPPDLHLTTRLSSVFGRQGWSVGDSQLLQVQWLDHDRISDAELVTPHHPTISGKQRTTENGVTRCYWTPTAHGQNMTIGTECG